jgi:hypothetical protein
MTTQATSRYFQAGGEGEEDLVAILCLPEDGVERACCPAGSGRRLSADEE